LEGYKLTLFAYVWVILPNSTNASDEGLGSEMSTNRPSGYWLGVDIARPANSYLVYSVGASLKFSDGVSSLLFRF
jgi:hypothetical protein